MDNSKARSEQLIDRYLSGEATPEERNELEALYMQAAAKKQLPDFAETDGEEIGRMGKESWLELISKIKRSKARSAIKGNKARSLVLWPGKAGGGTIWKVAAAVAAITLGVWLFYASDLSGLLGGRHPEPSLSSRASRDLNDVAPGKNTAMLTLSNGEVINLDTNRNSVVVADSVTSVTMLTASTPRGGTYQLVLSDGTKVWLNAGSKISFSSQFNGKQRKILLEGEAYFEVAHSKAKPFVVESEGQKVEVLGTHFNVNAYKDESEVKTTLLEGSVEVSSEAKSGMRYRLKPGQQSLFRSWENGAAQLQTIEVHAAEAIAWKEGNFIFNDEDLESILRKVARWYDVDIVYESKPAGVSLLGAVSRSKNVSAVLNALEQTGKVHFRIEGRRIVVMK